MVDDMRTKLLVVALIASLSGSVPSAPVGSIEGRVTFEAAPPSRRSALRYPGGAAATREIQQLPAVVYLVGDFDVSAEASRLRMSQRDTAFVPSVVVVGRGGAVSFPNEDPFFHNVFSYSSAQRFDLGRYPQGESKDVAFPEPGIVEVFCEVHEFMRGAIVVTENPFHAVVGPDGTFRIRGVPEGEHTLAVWHPDYPSIEQRVTVTSGSAARIDVVLRR